MSNNNPITEATPDDLESRAGKTSAVRRALLGGGVLLGAAALTTLIMATGPDGSPAEQTEKAWPVTVMRAAPSEMHPMFATYGRVEARTEAKLRTDIQAEVEKVYVQEGEWAREGELLIQLRAEEIELRLREANAEAEQEEAALSSTQIEYQMLRDTTDHYEQMYRISQQKFTRQQELAAKRMIPQALLDNAAQQASRDTIEFQNHKRALADFPSRIAQRKAAVTIARARAERAQLDLNKTKVIAPFTGPVLEVAVGPGDRTNATIALVTLADASTFEVRASIPNLYANRVRAALDNKQNISANVSNGLTAADQTNQQTPLQLARIAHNVRPGQSGLDAWFSFPRARIEAEQLPELGRVINLNTLLPLEPGLVALPAQAIYENDRVYLVTNNRLQAATIERIGEFKADSGADQVLVRGANLAAGTDVMTTALPKAISGLLVDPIRPVIQDETAIANGETSIDPSKLNPPTPPAPVSEASAANQKNNLILA